MRRLVRGDRAVTAVEAAFAIPILFLFVLGLVDLGLWSLETNKATNAARDGARTAIIDYVAADEAGADRARIEDAVEAHLPGQSLDAGDLVVSCIRPDGSDVLGGCANADPDEDRVRVEVTWDQPLITPIAGIIGVDTVAVDGVASMVIVGKPLAGSGGTPSEPEDPGPPDPDPEDPPECDVTDLEASPATNKAKNNGALQNNVDVTFTATGDAACDGLLVQLEAPGGNVVNHTCGCGSGSNRSWTYGKNSDGFWSPGTAEVHVYRGAVSLASTTFSVN